MLLHVKQSPNVFSHPSLLSLSLAPLLLLSCCYFQSASSLIVPQELPTILSLVYSNIPPIKKGTDSRLGFGFRLGEHADFQVLLELGPQKETKPIGTQAEDDVSFNKRQVTQKHQLEFTSTERPASWLENWSKDVSTNSRSRKKFKQGKEPANHKKQQEKLSPSTIAELPVMPVVPQPTLKQLQLLYKMAVTTTAASPITSTAEIKTTTTTPALFSPDPPNLGGTAGFTIPSTSTTVAASSSESPESLLLKFLQTRAAATPQKHKDVISKELMDVSLEDEK